MGKIGTLGLVTGLTMGAVLGAMSLPTLAASERSAVLEEVVVTARKIEESSQEVPVAITALSEQVLQRSTIRDMSDLNGYAPNVLIDQDGSRSNGANINIRGISPTRSDDNSFDAPVAVMIDGIYLGSLAGQVLENFDLERVEILRGPQGTLFGKNTVGGVVNVIRSRPTGETGFRVKATLGDNSQRELRLVANMPVIEDTLALKVFATSMLDDGYMVNTTTSNRIPRKDYRNFGATFLFEPNDRFEALLTVERFDDQSQLNAYQTNMNFEPGVASAPADDREVNLALGSLNCLIFQACRSSLEIPETAEMDTENDADLGITAYTLNLAYDVNENLALKLTSGIRDMSEYRIYDFDGSAAPFITIERFNEFEQSSHELRLEGQYDKFSFVAGAYLWDSEFEQDWITGASFWNVLFGGYIAAPDVGDVLIEVAPEFFLPLGPAGSSGLEACIDASWLFAPTVCDPGLTDADVQAFTAGAPITQILYETQETKSKALYFQGEYDVTDQLAVTLGVRWTEEEKHFIAGQAYLSTVERQRLRNFPSYADLTKKWTEVSPKLGLSYKVNDDALLYLSYSEGFHSGGFFGVNQNIRDFERDQYDPEYAKSTELGFKSLWLDNRLRFNLALFNNDFEDKQEAFIKLDPDTQTVATVFENAARVIYRGLEVELELAATENLTLFANYGYLDAEYDEFNIDVTPGDNVDNVVDATYLEPRNAPDNTLGIGFTGNWEFAGGELEVFTKFSTRGDFQTNVLNLESGRLSGGATDDLSASITYSLDNFSITFFGKNLTDERFEVPVVLGGSNTTNPLFIPGSVNRPRSWGVDVTFEI